MTTPTAFEQEMLELINRARANPQGEFDALIRDADSLSAYDSDVTAALRYFNVDLDLFASQLAGLDPAAPLAWNAALSTAADAHSAEMIAYDTQSHRLPGEAGLADRISAAGYDNYSLLGENIFAYGTSAEQAHAAFYIDWGIGPGGMQSPAGHRDSILNASFTEIGISAIPETDGSTQVGPYVITQNFGNRFDYVPQILGVVIDDQDGDAFYDAGEGLGNVGVTILDGETLVASTSTWAAGGYQTELAAGTYTAVFWGGGLQGSLRQTITMGSENLKVDALATDTDVTAGFAVGNGAADTFTGAAGQDAFYGRGGADTLTGASGNDSLYGGDQNDLLRGGDGNDRVLGGNGSDTAYLGRGDDVFQDNGQLGSGAADTIWAGGGNDTVLGAGGQEKVYGESGADSLIGGTGRDTLYGGDQNDTLRGGNDNDLIAGGKGSDLAYLGLGNDVFQDDTQTGANAADTIFGGGGNDTIIGRGGQDLIRGENGNDSLAGGLGADRLFGGNQDDRLDGGIGNDTLTGGSGADVFEFTADMNHDTITDYRKGTDRLAFDDALWGGGLTASELVSAHVTDLGQSLRFDFAGGHSLTLENVWNTDQLAADIDIL